MGPLKYFSSSFFKSPRERRKVLLLQLNIFLLITTLLILKPVITSDMLFQNGIGILPIAYIYIAITAILLHQILRRLIDRYTLIQIIAYNHLFHLIAFALIGVYFFSSIQASWISLSLYVYVALFGVLTITLFYQYLQSILSIRDAKRLYPLIGSAAISGGIFGGYLTSLIAPLFGSEVLILIGFACLLVSSAIYRSLTGLSTIDSADLQEPIDSDSHPEFKFLKTRTHVHHIAAIVGIGVFVSKIIDYQFNSVATETFLEEESLTSFFGFWFSTINVVGLMIQLFVTNKVINRFGVVKSTTVMPALLFAGSLFLIFIPTLLVVTLLKLFDGSLKQSIHKTSTDIFYMPLASRLRNNAKSFIDVVIDSIATGLAGILIFAIAGQRVFESSYLSYISLLVIAIWLYVLYKARESYRNEMINMISPEEDESEFEEPEPEDADNPPIGGKSKHQNIERLLILQFIRQKMDTRLDALKRLSKIHGKNLKKTLLKYTTAKDKRLAQSSFIGLALNARNDEELLELLEQFKGDLYKYCLLITAITKIQKNTPGAASSLKLHKEIDEAITRISDIKANDEPNYWPIYVEIYSAIALSRYKEKYGLIFEAIENPIDPKDQEAALISIKFGQNRTILESIKLSQIDTANKPFIYAALAAFPKYTLALCNRKLMQQPRKVIDYLPALKLIGNQATVNFLIYLLDHNRLKVRREALITLNYCRKEFPHLSYKDEKHRKRLRKELRRLKMLSACMVSLKDGEEAFPTYEKRLRKIINKSLLNCFILLSFISKREDLVLVYKALKNHKVELALDFLDDLLDYEIRKQSIPLFDMVAKNEYTMEEALRNGMTKFPSKKSVFSLIKKIDLESQTNTLGRLRERFIRKKPKPTPTESQ